MNREGDAPGSHASDRLREGSPAGQRAVGARPWRATFGGRALAAGLVALLAAATLAAPASAQYHRAEQTREITYWLLDPSTHQFRISHDFTVDTPGQRYVHSFVRAGSEVTDAEVWDVDAGEKLVSYNVTGEQINELGFYPNPRAEDSVAVQAELLEPVEEGQSVRVRVIETYTDSERYYMDGDELVWDRSLGRPYNTVKLPPGWMLTAVSVPAVVSIDQEGLVSLRFINPRTDSIGVVIRARRRPGTS